MKRYTVTDLAFEAARVVLICERQKKLIAKWERALRLIASLERGAAASIAASALAEKRK